MTRLHRAASALAAACLLGALSPAQATLYQFSFTSNQEALGTTQDHSLDVQNVITLDDTRISSFDIDTLRQTATWLNGGITWTTSFGGKTLTLNDALDPASVEIALPGRPSGSFLHADPFSPWFLVLSFDGEDAFIVDNDLPDDPFVSGFLFAYQDQQSYKDLNTLWTGNTSVLAAYAVPEPATWGLMAMGLAAAGIVARRKRGVSAA